MAQRLIRKTKKTTRRVSGAAAKAVDLKYYGAEPLQVDTRDQSAYINALNWYNYMYDSEQAKSWLVEYLRKQKYQKSNIEKIQRISKQNIPTTLGWQARIMLNGNTLSESSQRYFIRKIEELLNSVESTVQLPETDNTQVVSIQERTQNKIYQLITECEEAIDNDFDFDIYNWLQGKEASPQATNAIINFYRNWKNDFQPCNEDNRNQKKLKKQQYDYWVQFIESCERYLNNKKIVKIRKPRSKKVKSAVDLTKNLKFQKEYPPLQLASVNPVEIVGSKQVWVYNTKYRKLTVFNSSSVGGIQVKGTTLTHFDPELSITKRLRKPEDVLKMVTGAGKVALRSVMDNIKTTAISTNGRINNDIIILRVVK